VADLPLTLTPAALQKNLPMKPNAMWDWIFAALSPLENMMTS
jgi:hypothetical protein